MKLFPIPTLSMSLLGLCLLSGLDAPPAHADFVFGTPVNLKSVIPAIDALYDNVNCFSYDGLEVYIESERPNGYGDWDLWVLRRDALDAAWGPLENLGPVVNSSGVELRATIAADGLTLYFISARPGGQGNGDLYMTTRATREASWGPPVNLGPNINSSAVDSHPWISADGLELYFTSNRPGGYGGSDLWVTTRPTVDKDWGQPTNLGSTLNTSARESWPCTTPDGLVLFFYSNRPGSHQGASLYMAKRATRKDPWGVPVDLGPEHNGPPDPQVACISPDGRSLYFFSFALTRDLDNWQAPILPIVDFNGDGKVDEKDLALLLASWGKSNPVCDIGPFAWGDGIVDTYDLSVLLKEMTGSGIALNPRSDASEVACDAIFSWTSVSFAQSYDVYLGTSPEAVKTASRINPQGVLVSQGQTASTYDPPGPLEFSTTYYWRVDFVISSPAPLIYQGPVLKFTTEAYAYPIKKITATASSAQPNMGAEKTVNGSGLDKNDGHSTDGKDMWQSMMGVVPHWIQYEFDKVYALHELWVWNSNQAVEPFIGFGAKTVKIEYSTDGTKWTPLEGVPEFARATGKTGYLHNTTVSFGGVPAKYVKLTIEKGWGTTPSVGLSEVRFFQIPDRW